MRVRIISLPRDPRLEGFNLNQYQVGAVYDVESRFGELLMSMGLALLEMRDPKRAVVLTHPDRRRN